MIREHSSKQTVLDFCLPFEGELDPNNRWVKLAETIPWDELAIVYHRALHPTMGPPALPARVVIGAMIIKHMKKLSDEEVIEDIRENPYYQYFLGFSVFQYRTVFVPSLFVEIRKRLGMDKLQEINQMFLSQLESKDTDDSDDPPVTPPASPKITKQSGSASDSAMKPEEEKHSGMLIIDASVAPSDMRYPTDVDLLNKAREKAELLIDKLWQLNKTGVKPRTYRRVARKAYLAFTHQRQPGKKKIRKTIRKQLGYLSRDLVHIDRMLDAQKSRSFPLSPRLQRTLWIIRELYRQQKWMYDNRKHSIANRIVSIAQPHVRPIVRGKARNKTEFGAKLSAIVINGNVYLDHLSWDAYNESTDLIRAVNQYLERYGYYPESVNADKIYWNLDNRRFMKKNKIKLYGGAPLGRPKVHETLSPEEKRIHREESKRRNWIEGKFGEGKRRYGLGLVMAKTRRTSESWIAMVIFVMNLARQWRGLFLSQFYKAWRTLFAMDCWRKHQVQSIRNELMFCTTLEYHDAG